MPKKNKNNKYEIKLILPDYILDCLVEQCEKDDCNMNEKIEEILRGYLDFYEKI